MSLVKLMNECFSGCTVQNGIVHFQRTLNKDELFSVYSQFTSDLLNGEIPHWKVIGFYHGWDDVHQHSLFRCNDIYGMSLIELGEKLGDLIPTKNGGINPVKGCFYGEDEEVQNNKEFDEGFGRSASMRAGTKRANALKLHTSKIGSMMCDYEGPPDANPIPYLGSDTVWYTQFSYVEDAEYPTMLVPDVKVCNLKREGMGVPTIIMFIMRGTGKLDYAESQKYFDDSYDNIMPCKVVYNLSKYFTCAYPTGNELRLIYKRNINENALTEILRDYGKDWCE